MGSLSPFFAIGLGLAIGLEHAFEPDHVAAVSTQVSKLRSAKKQKYSLKKTITKSSFVGVLWGIGHTTSLALVGLLVYVLAIQITENVFFGLEFGVGLMLAFLGITTILNKRKELFGLKHRHPHTHKDGIIHFDEHDHSDSSHRHGHISYLIGMVHGLAGSGALVVLAASTFESVGTMITFTILFGMGSIIGMSLLSSAIGLPITFASKRQTVQKVFRYVAGGFSLLLGSFIMYEIGVLNDLFLIFKF